MSQAFDRRFTYHDIPKKFELDSMFVPKFFVFKEGRDDFPFGSVPAGQVFAQNGTHSDSGYAHLGIVAKQSPFGQGTGIGLKWEQVRPATKEEIYRAVAADHPHGANYRPSCRGAMDVSFHLVMSKCVRNWTADDARGVKPILPVTRQKLVDYGVEALTHHRGLMARWGRITREQVEAIYRHFDDEPPKPEGLPARTGRAVSEIMEWIAAQWMPRKFLKAINRLRGDGR